VFVLSGRVMAVILKFPVLSSSSVMNLPTCPPACGEVQCVMQGTSSKLEYAYADNGNLLDAIAEARRLLVRVMGHVAKR